MFALISNQNGDSPLSGILDSVAYKIINSSSIVFLFIGNHTMENLSEYLFVGHKLASPKKKCMCEVTCFCVS